ncbi:MAG: type IV toxin-antitoxin system AbiEi family antitoxin domain-containing protein [Actinobacteria bacterium]|nr:type IV toxin-antitoxin system AbiEi family antitoxin domain-containing protein [Actinomycetota bacterium]
MQRPLIEHLAIADGLVTTAQARELGVTKRQLDALVEQGTLERVHRGIYRVTLTPRTQRQRLLAGLLAVGERSVVSHRSAIDVQGAPNFGCSLVELTHASRSLPLRAGIVVHRSSTLAPADIEEIEGLRTTTKARTAVDACSLLPPTLVVRFVEHWLASRSLDVDDLLETVDRLRALPGAVRLSEALADRSLGGADADSVAERRLGEMLRKAGLPAEHHVVVTTSHGDTFELDWAYPAHRVGLEMDGYGIHMRSVHAFDRDRLRRNELENEGWQILNFTERHLRRSPDRVVRQVREALARREPYAHGPELDTTRDAGVSRWR